MKEIDIKDYFIEIIDEGRSTIGYDCVAYKTNELVHKIYKQNDELKRLERENKKLKKTKKIISNVSHQFVNDIDKLKKALEQIREIVLEPCVAGENCITCNSNCTNKDILNKINEVLK